MEINKSPLKTLIKASMRAKQKQNTIWLKAVLALAEKLAKSSKVAVPLNETHEKDAALQYRKGFDKALADGGTINEVELAFIDNLLDETFGVKARYTESEMDVMINSVLAEAATAGEKNIMGFVMKTIRTQNDPNRLDLGYVKKVVSATI